MLKKITQDISTILDEKLKDFREVFISDMIQILHRSFEEMARKIRCKNSDLKFQKIEKVLAVS